MFFGLLLAAGWQWGESLGRLDPLYRQATTACLATIVVMPAGNLVFGTAPLPARVWLLMLPMAAFMVMLEEGRKAWIRQDSARQRAGAAGNEGAS